MRDGKVTSPAVEQLVPGDIVLLERCGYNYALKPPTKSFEGVSRPASTRFSEVRCLRMQAKSRQLLQPFL